MVYKCKSSKGVGRRCYHDLKSCWWLLLVLVLLCLCSELELATPVKALLRSILLRSILTFEAHRSRLVPPKQRPQSVMHHSQPIISNNLRTILGHHSQWSLVNHTWLLKQRSSWLIHVRTSDEPVILPRHPIRCSAADVVLLQTLCARLTSASQWRRRSGVVLSSVRWRPPTANLACC